MPVELVRMICDYLTPIEIASIRSVSRTIAAIGLEYIATTVTLTLKEESFDRLLEIAHHPVVSKYVRNLRYEHDFLMDLSRQQWESRIRTPEFVAAEIKNAWIRAPRIGASKRAWRAFHRECRFYKSCNVYGTQRLNQAYLTYQKHCAEQDHTRRSDFFVDRLADGLQHLPNLKTIFMPTLGSYTRYQTEIANFLDGAGFDIFIIRSDSVAVTRSVLLAMDQAVCNMQNRNTEAAMAGDGVALRLRSRHSRDATDDDSACSNQADPEDTISNISCLGESDLGDKSGRVLRVENFSSESLNWGLFLEDEEMFEVMKKSISHLTNLGIRLLDDYSIKDPRDPHYTIHMEVAHECLERGRLHEFVTSAPGLEELDIAFGLKYTLLHIYLTDIVDSFHWTSLRKVHFQQIHLRIGDLEAFCSRHSSTLSDLSLGDLGADDMLLPPGGDMYSVFTNIREATKLEKASVYGIFRLSHYWNLHDHTDERRASGTLIGRYLVGEGGNSRLEDFIDEERVRISKEDSESSVGDIAA